MVILTKQQVIAKIKDVDDKAKYFIYKAIDCKKLELKEIKKDAFVVNGDIDDVEFNI